MLNVPRKKGAVGIFHMNSVYERSMSLESDADLGIMDKIFESEEATAVMLSVEIV